MKQYKPPISSRGTEELIAIANGTTEDWQQDAIDQAKDELRRRNITREQQMVVLDKWKEEDEKVALDYQKQLEQNESEGYNVFKMMYIFLVAPFIILGRWNVGPSLWELKRENYKRKFKQRLFLIICGTLFWIMYFMVMILEQERNRQAEIDRFQKADVSDQEKAGYGTDSLASKEAKQ